MQFSKSFYLPKNRLEKGLLVWTISTGVVRVNHRERNTTSKIVHNVTNIDCLHKVNNEKFEQLYLSAIQKLRILSIKTFIIIDLIKGLMLIFHLTTKKEIISSECRYWYEFQ